MMFWKFVNFLVMVTVMVVAGEKTREEVFEKCAKDLGMTEGEIKTLFAEGFTETFYRNSKCFFKCMMQEFEVMDSDGVVNEDKLKEFHLNDLPCIHSNWTDDICAQAVVIFKCASSPVRQPVIHGNCYNELGSDEDKEGFLNATSQYDDAKMNNQKYKCYFKCVYQDREWMDENGNISKMNVSRSLEWTETEMNELGHCFDVNGNDICDKAFNFHKCYTNWGKQ